MPQWIDIPGGRLQQRDPPARFEVAPFRISRTEITVEQFRLFIKYTGYSNPAWTDFPSTGTSTDLSWDRPRYEHADTFPVVCVSARDAMAFAGWLSEQIGQPLRLPTELEWEYAARAGTATRFWWGDEYQERYAECFGCGPRPPQHPTYVGARAPNPFGLLDISGNVREWTCTPFATRGAGSVGSCAPHFDEATNLVLRVFGIKGVAEPNLTEDEIKALISQGAETGAVGATEENIVQRVFQLGDQRVAAIMTPRPDIVAIATTAAPHREMAEFALLKAAGPHIGFPFDHVISVQEAGYFKPHWKTYAKAEEIIANGSATHGLLGAVVAALPLPKRGEVEPQAVRGRASTRSRRPRRRCRGGRGCTSRNGTSRTSARSAGCRSSWALPAATTAFRNSRRSRWARTASLPMVRRSHGATPTSSWAHGAARSSGPRKWRRARGGKG